jgi:hypothetical protein
MLLTARPLWCLVVSSSLLVSAPDLVSAQAPAGQAAERDVAQLWADFNHFTRIARPELAAAAGEALIERAEPEELLEAVERGTYRNWEATIELGKRTQGLSEVASAVEQRIQQARVGVARDPERIAADIELLPQGGRPYANAVARLRAAGQYAAPQMLQALSDPNRARLHPHVMSAMAAIGQPMAAPLARALPELPAVTQTQVAQVLAEIGYPFPALPYLRETIDNEQTDPTARRSLQTAFNLLVQRSDVPQNLPAAELYLVLGEGRYSQGSRGEAVPGYDASEGVGVVWEYGVRTGLVAVPVPGPVFADVLAMRAAQNALRLNPNLDQALSLYLMANLRRENRMPEGAEDPSYPQDMQPASFYAMLAGPARLHDVLARALRDMDGPLALDAIEALASTAGTDALIAREQAQQPLLRALSFPDRLVRFRAAEALANARPTEAFTGSDRVVPVITEAIRPAGTRYALVIASTQSRVNDLLATVGDLGFEAFGGVTLTDVSSELRARPAVDLMVVDVEAQRMGSLLQQTGRDYMLGAVPIVSVTSRDRQITLQETFGGERRLLSVVDTGDVQTLASAVEQAMATAGPQIDEAMADDLALTALSLLRDIALRGSVYRVAEAEAALVTALEDPRDDVVVGAAEVLAMINSARAQEAIARTALEIAGDLQVLLLNSLAESATHHGNLVSSQTSDRVLRLIQETDGDNALAAARAHGALSLPTQNAVRLIVR